MSEAEKKCSREQLERSKIILRLNILVDNQQARIAELERQLQDKPDYRTLIRFPTEP